LVKNLNVPVKFNMTLNISVTSIETVQNPRLKGGSLQYNGVFNVLSNSVMLNFLWQPTSYKSWEEVAISITYKDYSGNNKITAVTVGISTYAPIAAYDSLPLIGNFILSESTLSSTRGLFSRFKTMVKNKYEQDFLSKQRFKSCAVVGASGNLRNASRGRDIDAHDIVIRINEPVIENFEEDVGTKTTVMFTNGLVPLCNLTKYIHQQIIIYSQIVLPKQASDWKICADRIGWENLSKVFIIDPYFTYVADEMIRRYTKGDKGYTFRTTGFMAIMAALLRCDEVYAYGFGPALNGFLHYYDEKPGDVYWVGHDITAEEEIRVDLEHNPSVVYPISTWGINKLKVIRENDFI